MFGGRWRARRGRDARHRGRHCGRHCGPGRYGSPRRRHALHRKLFWWFGATLLVVAAAMMFGVNLLGGPRWRQDAQAIERLASRQFAEVWQRPAERDRLAADIAQSFGADVSLSDAAGQTLAAYGRQCTAKQGYRLHIASLGEPGRVLGTVHLCRNRNHKSALWGFALGGLVLWIAVGIMSRRLSRPLRSLSRAVRSFGEGDLTQRAAAAVTDDTTEVGEVGRAFNEMAHKLSHQLRDQKELLAAVSHEVRTPLGRMKVLAELVRVEGAGDAAGPLLDDLDHEIDAVDRLVEQLLASARLEFRISEPQPLDIRDVLQAALKQSSSEAPLSGVERPLRLLGDAGLLVRMFANLIENANHHGGGITGISVNTEKYTADEARETADGGAEWVVVTVYDSGPGFDPAIVERAFESFTRTSSSGGGLGLGLSIVARIARAHGGHARVRKLSEGTGVEVRLPLSG